MTIDTILVTVLEVINRELWPDQVEYAELLKKHNEPMVQKLEEIYRGSGASVESINHEEMYEYAESAKAIIRTGEFTPWGNVAIQAGVDPKLWFRENDIEMPPDELSRFQDIYASDDLG